MLEWGLAQTKLPGENSLLPVAHETSITKGEIRMNSFYTVLAVSILVLTTLVAPAPIKGLNVNSPQADNMSPCFPEEVQACQASGGTFDWRHCMCWY